jgi:hypothetical protein
VFHYQKSKQKYEKLVENCFEINMFLIQIKSRRTKNVLAALIIFIQNYKIFFFFIKVLEIFNNSKTKLIKRAK